MDTYQKEKLAFIIKEFFKTLSRSEYEKFYNRATNFKTKNFVKNIYNKLINKPINLVLSGSLEVVSDGVRNSLGLPPPETKSFYKSYLPEIPTEKLEKDQEINNKLLSDSKALKSIISDLAEIITQCGFNKPVIFFDKIDEYPKLGSNIRNISTFLVDVLKDTSLLLNPGISFVFSIWDAIKPELSSQGIRFDKIKPLDITWNDEHLQEILDKRLKYFSGSKVQRKDVIKDLNDYSEIISLSNKSPRYLFRLLSIIYDQQNTNNSNSKIFETKNIQRGQRIFAETFDFYAIFPGNRGNKQDIITNVNRLLRIGKKQIMTKDFVEIFKVSNPTAINYIKIHKDYGLISEDSETVNGAKIFNINNPIIVNLIENGVKEMKK
ncbi:hypothetical protein AAOE16_01285 [Ekhidna sp. MALMAid0563]|uniref:hypothetical protein n=1 Tax=Ekhidna sp. MALMAid0563 TaxID=3143937 RepID=UPI0032DE9952